MDSTAAEASRRSWGGNLIMWVALLAVLYPLSLGPLIYVHIRDWISTSAAQPFYDSAYAPVIYLIDHDVPLLNGPVVAYRRYMMWWQDLAIEHDNSAKAATPAP